MRKKTARAICLEILNRIEKNSFHPDQLLSESFKRYRHLTAIDRAFLTELTYGVIRWKRRLDWIIQFFSEVPIHKIEIEILNVLRMGLYQILFLSRTPASAAVNESVELAKGFRGRGGGGFVNAILRSILRKKDEIHYPDVNRDPVLNLSIIESYPLWLVQRWIREMGFQETLRLCQFNNHLSPLTLRTNTLKISRKALIEKLKEKGLNPSPTHFSEDGIILQDPPPISELPFMREGFFIVQDEASQLVTAILDPKPGEWILDACAAPGAKTTHIAQRMENRGEVFALDIKKNRLALIEENSKRLGIPIIKMIRGDASLPVPLSGEIKFDRILADVPCSGFGTLRKNPDLKWRRTEQDILRLAELQLSILKSLAGYVKRGGILVYSTCTVFREENEDVVEKFLNEHPEFRPDRIDPILPEECHSLIKDGYFKTFPPRDEMDGFFVARLTKAG